MRDAYGSANSEISSTSPRGANASTSSSASAWNRGRIASIARLRKAGPSSRRSRRWSSPSRLSSVSPHQVANGPEWTPFCAGHRALPCWNRRSLSTATACSYRSTAQPQGVWTYQDSSRARCTTSEVTSNAGSDRSNQGTAAVMAGG